MARKGLKIPPKAMLGGLTTPHKKGGGAPTPSLAPQPRRPLERKTHALALEFFLSPRYRAQAGTSAEQGEQHAYDTNRVIYQEVRARGGTGAAAGTENQRRKCALESVLQAACAGSELVLLIPVQEREFAEIAECLKT